MIHHRGEDDRQVLPHGRHEVAREAHFVLAQSLVVGCVDGGDGVAEGFFFADLWGRVGEG
jgi:hypothetical protein